MTTTTIYETIGADTLTVTTATGTTLTFHGNTTSTMSSIVEDSLRILTDEQFVVLKQELSANISPNVQFFTISHGTTFTVDGWDDVTYDGAFIGNVWCGEGNV